MSSNPNHSCSSSFNIFSLIKNLGKSREKSLSHAFKGFDTRQSDFQAQWQVQRAIDAQRAQNDYYARQRSVSSFDYSYGGTNFLVSSNGFVSPVPSGATGPKSTWTPGVMFDGGSGGHGFDSRTSGVRVMDASGNHPQRTVYMDKNDHVVDPFTGKQDMKGGHFPHDE